MRWPEQEAPIHLSAEEWRAVLAAAAELDLVRGGLYRARPQAILFYCSPENAPPGWDAGFPDGAPEAPRAHVGEAEVVDAGEANGVCIRLTVSNWTAMRALKRAYDRGQYRDRFPEFIRDQEAALRGRPEDREWLRLQFRRLRQHAAGELLR